MIKCLKVIASRIGLHHRVFVLFILLSACPVILMSGLSNYWTQSSMSELTTEIVEQDGNTAGAEMGQQGEKIINGRLETLLVRSRNMSILMILLCVGMAYIVASYSSKYVVSPLKKLVGSAEAVAQGNLNGEIHVEGNDEIGALLQSFNEMRKGLQESMVSKSFMNTIVNSMSDAMVTVDTDHHIVEVNTAFCSLLGYTREQAIGQLCQEILYQPSTADDEINGFHVLQKVIVNGEPITVTQTCTKRDGSTFESEISASPVREQDGKIVQLVMVVRDVTERKQNEERRRYLASIIAKTDAPIYSTDLDGNVCLWNEASERLTGYKASEVMGKCIPTIPCSSNQIAKTLQDGQCTREHELITKDGCRIPIYLSTFVLRDGEGKPKEISGFTIDIAEVKLLQEQLTQSEKLAAIGELVSGIAHELNNPLTGVLGFSELLLNEGHNGKTKKSIEKIHGEAKRCKRIVSNLLTFARKHRQEKKLVDLNEIIQNTLDLRAYDLSVNNIVVNTSFATNLPAVMGDSHQLQQAFLNIINNAEHAILEVGGNGTISVRTSLVGDTIRVSIADTGCGISEAAISKVFDPFFTTKEPGHGTGLGLSICYGIVKEHDGNIRVVSKHGEGARFVVELHVRAKQQDNHTEDFQQFWADAEFSHQPAELAVKDNGQIDPLQAVSDKHDPANKRILVVDDEGIVLVLLSTVLNQCGYITDAVNNGQEAIDRIDSNDYDLVVADIRMPDVDGPALYEHVLKHKPELASRFLFATGDAINGETREFFDAYNVTWIEKPFDIDLLLAKVESMVEWSPVGKSA